MLGHLYLIGMWLGVTPRTNTKKTFKRDWTTRSEYDNYFTLNGHFYFYFYFFILFYFMKPFSEHKNLHFDVDLDIHMSSKNYEESG